MYSQKALFITLLTAPSPSETVTNPTNLYFPCATESLCVLLLLSDATLICKSPANWELRGAEGREAGTRWRDRERWGRGALIAAGRMAVSTWSWAWRWCLAGDGAGLGVPYQQVILQAKLF